MDSVTKPIEYLYWFGKLSKSWGNEFYVEAWVELVVLIQATEKQALISPDRIGYERTMDCRGSLSRDASMRYERPRLSFTRTRSAAFRYQKISIGDDVQM